MADVSIVISRSGAADAARSEFENALIKRFRGATGAPVLVMGPLYQLSDDCESLAAFAAISGDIVYASWHHPRASHWLLAAQGIRADERSIRCFDLRRFSDVDSCAEALLAAAGPWINPGPADVRVVDAPVESRWYPVIDYSACTACGQCHDFCLFGVYSLTEDGKPAVTSPDSCKPGCVACARLCPVSAIIYPDSADERISGDLDAPPHAVPVDAPAYFGRAGAPCPLCGCACDCERSTDGTAPPGKTVCPACGCICDNAGPCACKPKPVAEDVRDDLDDLIDALDKLDV